MINEINETIKSIGYIALCLSLIMFITIKFLKYLLARKKFNLLSTPILTPMVKTPELPKP